MNIVTKFQTSKGTFTVIDTGGSCGDILKSIDVFNDTHFFKLSDITEKQIKTILAPHEIRRVEDFENVFKLSERIVFERLMDGLGVNMHNEHYYLTKMKNSKSYEFDHFNRLLFI